MGDSFVLRTQDIGQLTAVRVPSTFEQTLTDPVPPISDELASYIESFYTASPPQTGITDAPIVGFNGQVLTAEDTGHPGLRYEPGPEIFDQIAGNGIDELVAFSFNIPEIVGQNVQSANLTFELTPQSVVSTDQIFFADNNSTGAELYGQSVLAQLERGERTEVDFDLSAMPSAAGPVDLRDLLLDGTLDVLYGDDAIIHSAGLRVTTVSEPSTLVLMGFGVAFMICLVKGTGQGSGPRQQKCTTVRFRCLEAVYPRFGRSLA